ncbi:sugar phosphate isomerase/epimerase, partial [Gammaproteobacteria bacterium]|nr:sugar phosphate isomerase/epimerase [Gammaproteobacteria bacterium]
MHKIGYMQGRLSEIIDNKIQAFPIKSWTKEIVEGSKNNLCHIEWTLDHQGIEDNPFMTKDGQNKIKSLCQTHDVNILSVTGDCFMQAPIWKLGKIYEKDLINEFLAVIDACNKLDVGIVVVPCVDSSSIQTTQEEEKFLNFCNKYYQE